jgi:hypothetical protein
MRGGVVRRGELHGGHSRNRTGVATVTYRRMKGSGARMKSRGRALL